MLASFESTWLSFSLASLLITFNFSYLGDKLVLAYEELYETDALLVVPANTLFKLFAFENGIRMPDKKLVILEFKYHQNKKW